MRRGQGSRQLPILRLLQDGKARTCREIATETGIPPGKTAQVIERLYDWGQAGGLVSAVGKSATGARKYTLSAAGQAHLDYVSQS
jgi:DNA-binding IclR family transcriptional regulator